MDENILPKTETPNQHSQHRTIKQRFCNILISSKPFCCICLASDAELFSIDDYVTSDWDSEFLPTWRYIWNEMFVRSINFLSNHMCQACKEKSYTAYSLINNTQQTMNSLEDFVIQINSQIDNIKDTDLNGCPNTCLILKDPRQRQVEVKIEENLHEYEILIDNNINNKRHNEIEVQIENERMLEEHEDGLTKIKLPKKEKGLCKKNRKLKRKRKTELKHSRKKTKKEKTCLKDSDYEVYTEIEYLDEDLFNEDNNKTITEIKHDNTLKTHEEDLNDNSNTAIEFLKDGNSKKKSKTSNSKGGLKPLCVVKGELRKKTTNIEVEDETFENCSGDYYCDYCGKRCNSRHGIILHLKQNHEINKSRRKTKYACCECDEVPCRHKKYIQAYYTQVQAGKKIVACPDCDFGCLKKSTLIGHANQKHLKHVSFICEFCRQLFYSKSKYDNHIMRYHTNRFSCKICDRKFKLEERMISHQTQCEKVKREFKCDECPAALETAKKLKYHKIKHESQFPCTFCDKVFSMRSMLLQHLKWHKEGSGARKYTINCLFCGMKFRSTVERNEHMAQHDPNDTYKCFACNVEVKTLKAYRLHINKFSHRFNVDPTNTHKFKCDYCHKYSTSKMMQLEAHINRYHLKITPYSCPKCHKKFLSSFLLQKHQETHEEKPHEVKNRFFCETCGKTFCSGASMRVHIRKHTGERPFQCEMCGDGFVSASRRKVHMDTAHRERNIYCPLCDYAGSIVPQVRTHIRNSHWDKKSGKKFDYRKVVGLMQEHYYLFTDRRFFNQSNKNLLKNSGSIM